MKQEKEDLLVETLLGYSDKTAEFSGTVVEWVMQQTPDLANQIVLYGRASSSVGVLCCIGLFVTGFLIAKTFWDKASDGDDRALVLFISGLASAIPATVLGCIADYCFLAWFAPKLYLLSYLKDLV